MKITLIRDKKNILHFQINVLLENFVGVDVETTRIHNIYYREMQLWDNIVISIYLYTSVLLVWNFLGSMMNDFAWCW